MLSFNPVQVSLNGCDPVAEDSAAKGWMEAAERVYISHRAAGWHLVLPIPLFKAGDGGEADEVAFDGRRKVAEDGQEFFSNSIAEETRVVVRGVLSPFEALKGQILPDCLPRDV